MNIKPLCLSIAALCLSACMTFPHQATQQPEPITPPEAYLNASANASDNEAELAQWWHSFNDERMVSLVEMGLAENLDIDVAGARVRQARANLKAERSSFWPTLSASQSVSRSRDFDSGQSFDSNYQSSFDASYEIDLFGGTRNSVKAARADVESVEANLRSTQLTVSADIVLYYIDVRTAQTRLINTRATLQSQAETLQIVEWRQRAGLVSSLDLEQARQLYAQTSASIPNLENSYRSALNRLAVLLARNPGSIDQLLVNESPIPTPPTLINSGVPASLLERRPDVQAAQQNVLEEMARVGVQRAELLPSLRLNGSISGSDDSPVNLLDLNLGNIIASLSAPIFNGGRLRARLSAQQSSAQAAVSSYRKTALTAFEETENALFTLEAARRRTVDLSVAENAARNAALLARSQYKAGLIGFDRLLETERSLLTALDNSALVNADKAKAAARLFKALGGGWQLAPRPESAKDQPPSLFKGKQP